MDVAYSVNRVPIRLTDERWGHLVVIYREPNANDGFVVTAYFVRRVDRKRAIWRR
ncbi:MAG TPA: hypothetical protein VGF55_30410 [Gemmataceae bacterium]|jgi:hypothetical protein